jgi:hypothetical protein
MHATSVRGAPIWIPDDATATTEVQLSEGIDLFGDALPDMGLDTQVTNTAACGDDVDTEDVDPEESAMDDALASLTDDVQRLNV